MKKLSQKQKFFLIRRSLRIERKRRLVKKHRGQRGQSYSIYVVGRGMHRKMTCKLSLPCSFRLGRNYDETVDFIRRLRKQVSANIKLELDFFPLKDIGSAGALVLAAEIDRWCRKKQIHPRVLEVKRWDPTIRALLHDMGLFSLVRATNLDKIHGDFSRDLKFISFQSGKIAEGYKAEKLFRHLAEIGAQIGSNQRYLFEGLTEAMTNVVQHAYPEGFDYQTPVIQNLWWMSGSFDARSRRVTVTFFDQGVGIPYTLQSKHSSWLYAALESLGYPDNDAQRIGAAMKIGRSRTRQPHRGRGLKNIKEYTDNVKDGELRIFSGKGEYLYASARKEDYKNHHESLGGTLIQWSGIL